MITKQERWHCDLCGDEQGGESPFVPKDWMEVKVTNKGGTLSIQLCPVCADATAEEVRKRNITYDRT